MLGSATGRLANVAQCVHDRQRGGFTAARQAQPGAFAHQLSCCGCSALAGGGGGEGDGYHTIHELAPNARVYTYSSANPPGAVVQSGDAIEVQCLDASDGWLEASGPGSTTEHYAKRRHTPEIMEQFPGNPVCEPVFVEGAEPGDTLQVELLELRTADWGWTGGIPTPNPAHCLSAVFRPFCAVFPPSLCVARLPGAETERTGEKWRKMGEIWGRNGRETAVAEWRWGQCGAASACSTATPSSPRTGCGSGSFTRRRASRVSSARRGSRCRIALSAGA